MCRLPCKVALGAVPPLGRVAAEDLRRLADLADATGGALRLTPWQSVMLVNLAAEDAAGVLSELERMAFVTRRDQTLGAIIACTGALCTNSSLNSRMPALRRSAMALTMNAGQNFASSSFVATG